MASVSVNTGPIAADDSPRDVPKDRWFLLLLARRSAIQTNLPYDCRSLLNYVREAEEFRMWEHTRHADLDDLIRNGLKIDPELLHWAKRGLEAFGEDVPVPFQLAVETGKKTAAEVMVKAQPLAAHGEIGRGREREDRVDNINSNQGGTSVPYLAARLKRDAPEIAARVEAGEFRSIRQAAIEAGIVKVTPPLTFLKCAWRKATPEERQQFLAWTANG